MASTALRADSASANPTSRRGVLAALALAPAIISTQALASASPIHWDGLKAKYERLLLDQQNHDAQFANPLSEECKRIFGRAVRIGLPRRAEFEAWAESSGYNDVYERSEMFGEEVHNLWKMLIGMPAPHNSALLWKIEETLTEGAAWHEDITNAVWRDCRRILGN
ncbi:hypothetical protein BH10PSE12_BH10PSE12_01910 [soil metagenome]